jgi:hypothetical protein
MPAERLRTTAIQPRAALLMMCGAAALPMLRFHNSINITMAG